MTLHRLSRPFFVIILIIAGLFAEDIQISKDGRQGVMEASKNLLKMAHSMHILYILLHNNNKETAQSSFIIVPR